MNTEHRLYFTDSRLLDALDNCSIDLVVTSPPYPMISMWDQVFSGLDGSIENLLSQARGWDAYKRMHAVLDPVWEELCRVIRPGGFVCVNIGDAVRKLGDSFSLYPNHSEIIRAFLSRGLTPLPAIIWRKQTNAPNKFMGSGMLPAGAYVTLEHEYVLIFRKGAKRQFATPAQKLNRKKSAIFWEERNQWYSDVWFDLKGARQQLVEEKLRRRSGAYPFELPYRLINMYSVMSDTVLDPFAGIFTTMFAAMAAGRNSVMVELDAGFSQVAQQKAREIKGFANSVIESRIRRHLEFEKQRRDSGRPPGHVNENYGFSVMTGQEKSLALHPLTCVSRKNQNLYTAEYGPPVMPADLPVQQSLFEGKA